MKLWWPLLAVLPAGLMLGMVGGRMVDSSNPRDPAARDSAVPPSRPAPAVANAVAAPDDQGFGPVGDQRPDLDWDAQYWPRDRGGGPYALDDDYFGRGDADYADADYGDAAPDSPALAGSAGEAIAAAQAAERAAGDAVRAARVAAPPAAAPRPLARPAEMPIATTSREPRAAEGDLPAIW